MKLLTVSLLLVSTVLIYSGTTKQARQETQLLEFNLSSSENIECTQARQAKELSVARDNQILNKACMIEAMHGFIVADDLDHDGSQELLLPNLHGDDPLIKFDPDKQEMVVLNHQIGLPDDLGQVSAGIMLDVWGDSNTDIVLFDINIPEPVVWGWEKDKYVKVNSTANYEWNKLGVVFGVTAGDIDNDGIVEIFTAEWSQSTGDGTGSYAYRPTVKNNEVHFEEITQKIGTGQDTRAELTDPDRPEPGSWWFAPSLTDIDNDFDLDLLVAGDFGGTDIYLNDGDGQFKNSNNRYGVGLDENGMGSTIGDFNNDGKLDWLVTSIFNDGKLCSPTVCVPPKSGNKLYINKSLEELSFTATNNISSKILETGWAWGATSLDWDMDGQLDIATVNGYPTFGDKQPNAISRGFNAESGWIFTEGLKQETQLPEEFMDKRSLVTADINGDKKPDLITRGSADNVVILLNNNEAKQEQIEVSLNSIDSISSLYGARIVAYDELNSPVLTTGFGISNNFSSSPSNNLLIYNDEIEYLEIVTGSGEIIRLSKANL